MGASNGSKDELNGSVTSDLDPSFPYEDVTVNSTSNYSILIHPPNPGPAALLTESKPDENKYSLADRLSEQVKDLETYKALYLHEVRETAQLRTTVSALQNSVETSIDSIGRLELDLSLHRSREESLILENQAIKQRISSIQSIPRKSLPGERLKKLRKTHFLHLFVSTQEQLLSSALRVWRLNLVEPVGCGGGVTDVDCDLMLKDAVTRSNSLIKSLLLKGLTWSTAMSKSRLISFCDGLFEAKFISDREDSTYGIPPKPLETYFDDYLKSQFHSESGRNQHCSRFIPGLFRLYQEGDNYGELLARLFSLFHPRPIPAEVCSFFIKAKVDFRRLKSQNYTGKVTIWQAVSSLNDLFSSQIVLQKVAILALKPDTMSESQYILHLLQHKMEANGRNAKEIFRSLDKRLKGRLNCQELAGKLCEMLNFYTDLEELAGIFPSQTLTLKDFCSLLSRPLPSDLYISAEKYLTALGFAYDSLIDSQMDQLTTVFYDISASNQEITRLETQKALLKLDPSLTQAQIRSYTTNVVRPLALSEFQDLIFTSKIADFGSGPFTLRPSKKPKIPLHEKNCFLTPEAKNKKSFEFDSMSKSRISMSRSSSKGKLRS